MINLENAHDNKKWRKVILIGGLLLAAILVSLVFDLGELKKFLLKYKEIALIVCLMAYVLLGLTFIPSEPVTILVLTLNGPLIAIIMATLGNTLSGLIEYFIGGNIGDLSDFESKKEKLPFHLGQLPINSTAFQLLGRMLPGFGPKFVSIASGVYRIPIAKYIWIMVVSNLIGAIIIGMGGFGLLRLFHL